MRMNKLVPKGGQIPGWVLRVGHAIGGPGFDPASIPPEFKYTLVNSRLGVFHPVSYVLFDLFAFTACLCGVPCKLAERVNFLS